MSVKTTLGECGDKATLDRTFASPLSQHVTVVQVAFDTSGTFVDIGIVFFNAGNSKSVREAA